MDVSAEGARDEGKRVGDYEGGPVPWDQDDVSDYYEQTDR